MKLSAIVILWLSLWLSISSAAQQQKLVWGVWYNSYQQPDISFRQKQDQPLLASHLAFFRQIGITRVYFLVKFPTGHVFYNSTIAPRHPKLDWDPFAFIVKECRRLQLEIYPYVNVYPEGGYNEKTRRHDQFGPYLKKFPERAMQDITGQKYGWACPALAQVEKYQLAILEEIVKNYAIDGIQLDRIRYPDNQAGYHRECQKLYQQKYGKKPVAGDYDWTVFRQELLSNFVSKSVQRLHRLRPQLKISAAVFPRPHSAAANQLQAWPRWTRRGLLCEIVPMTYYRTSDLFQQYLAEDLEVTPPDVPLLAGIGAFFITDPKIICQQIDFALQRAVQGIVFFNGYDLWKRPKLAQLVKKYTAKKTTIK